MNCRRFFGALAALSILHVSIAASAETTSPSPAPATPLADWTPADAPNQPFGTARGAQPGRVVWAHDPAAATWDGHTGTWWDERANDQAAVDRMVATGIRQLAGATTDAAAFEALFRDFNRRYGRGDTGYRAGQKIAVKINENNTGNHGTTDVINASPQFVLALLKALVNGAGVPEDAITVFDASRYITADVYDKSHAVFPGVHFVDNAGGDGREKTTYVADAIPFSVDTGLQSGLATCLVEADYVVDMALLKGHGGQGVTLCGKNWFGATSIQADWRKNFHAFFNPPRDGSPSYMAFVDFMGHKHMGGKTFLFLIDALYANDLVYGVPHLRWKMAPFNGAWPSSVFLSQDGVAIDSVGIDFLRNEWPDLADLPWCDTYLHEAARADAPASGAVYDPERDGSRLPSLGVHEHWNNAVEKKYSRNLGTGEGIELVYLPTGAQDS